MPRRCPVRARHFSQVFGQDFLLLSGNVFSELSLLIRNADLLALEECLCAGLPSSHLASRQVPRAADNFEFFADYIGVMAGETFQQMAGYQTVVTRQPAGVAALLRLECAAGAGQYADCLGHCFRKYLCIEAIEFTPLSMLRWFRSLRRRAAPRGS